MKNRLTTKLLSLTGGSLPSGYNTRKSRKAALCRYSGLTADLLDEKLSSGQVDAAFICIEAMTTQPLGSSHDLLCVIQKEDPSGVLRSFILDCMMRWEEKVQNVLSMERKKLHQEYFGDEKLPFNTDGNVHPVTVEWLLFPYRYSAFPGRSHDDTPDSRTIAPDAVGRYDFDRNTVCDDFVSLFEQFRSDSRYDTEMYPGESRLLGELISELFERLDCLGQEGYEDLQYSVCSLFAQRQRSLSPQNKE